MIQKSAVRKGDKSVEKVLVGMSGGVDSTYAALRLREMGYEVHGAVLRMHDYTEIKEAEESAAAIGIPLVVVDCVNLFSSCVISEILLSRITLQNSICSMMRFSISSS